ncbi:MAG: hypothetical protein Q9160_004687 [Pyrenula sp. 1 TL-2023]
MSGSPVTAVKVAYKDDNLGLGAKVGEQEKDLSADLFAGLLGRLNGRAEEELVEEEKKREQRRLEKYVMGKWGGVLFVKGGVLVQTEDFKKTAEPETRTKIEASDVDETMASNEKATRKREKAERRRRKEEKRKAKEAQTTTLDDSLSPTAGSCEDSTSPRDSSETKGSLEKARKQRKTDKKKALSSKDDTGPPHTTQETVLSLAHDSPTKTHSKAEKRKRRAEKCVRESRVSPTVDDSPTDSNNGKQSTSAQSKFPESETAISKAPEPRASSVPTGRHIIRGRHIAQKRAAFLNDSSLKGIFTAKAR